MRWKTLLPLMIGAALVQTPASAFDFERPGTLLIQSAGEALRDLDGQWSLDPTCSADDARVTFEIEEPSEQVTTGPVSFSFHTPEGSCHASEPRISGNGFEWAAQCTAEGETFAGDVILENRDGQLYMESPVMGGVINPCERQDTEVATADQSPKVRPIPQTSSAPSLMSEGQQNAIATVYRDYCEPDFETRSGWSVGEADSNFYESYSNQLFVRYTANCTQFFLNEMSRVLAIKAINILIQLPNKPSELDERGGEAVGFWQFMTTGDMQRCKPEVVQLALSEHGSVPEALTQLASEADRSNIVEGYRQGLILWTQLSQRYGALICASGAPLNMSNMMFAITATTDNVIQN